MKALPLAPPAMSAAPAWSGLLPVLGGGIALMAMMMGLYGKKKKMTKLEKACLTFVLAITEKVEHLENERERLSDRLAESASNLQMEKARADRLDKLAEEQTTRLIEAEAKVRELEAKLAATTKPTRASRRREHLR